MSYEKTMKHCMNHRKNRFYQPCGFSMNGSQKSGIVIALANAVSYHVCKKIDGGMD